MSQPEKRKSRLSIERRSDAYYRPLQWSIVKRMFKVLSGHLRMFVPAVVMVLLATGLDLIVPKFLKNAVDVHIASGSISGLLNICLQIVLLLTCAFLCRSLSQFLQRLSAERMLVKMRTDVFRRIQGIDMSYFDRIPVGILISRGHRDLMILVNVMMQAVVVILESLVIYFGVLIILFGISREVFWLVVAISPVMWFSSYVYHRLGRLAWRRVRRDIAKLTANVAEMASGVRVVQAFSRQDTNLDIYDRMNEVNSRSYMRTARFQGWYMLIVESLAFLTAGLVLGWSSWQVSQSTETVQANGEILRTGMQIGTFLALWRYIGMVFQPVRRIANLYNRMLQGMASGERVFALLDREPAIVDAKNAKDIGRIDGLVEFENVGFEYVKGQPVLKGINLKIESGTTLALVGHTGCGKTTIVNLLNRFYEVTSGSIRIDGVDLRDIQLQCLQSQTGLILQENFLFEGTVLDNIRFAAASKSESEIIELCTMLGCHHIFERLSDGYHTPVGQRGENLSAGQRQLVSIARAMAAGPRLLMLDEATSSVDTQTEMAIQYALDKLMERRTCIVVAHRLSTVRRAEQILVMDHGEIIERGTHEELLELGGMYAGLHEEFMKVEDE